MIGTRYLINNKSCISSSFSSRGSTLFHPRPSASPGPSTTGTLINRPSPTDLWIAVSLPVSLSSPQDQPLRESGSKSLACERDLSEIDPRSPAASPTPAEIPGRIRSRRSFGAIIISSPARGPSESDLPCGGTIRRPARSHPRCLPSPRHSATLLLLLLLVRCRASTRPVRVHACDPRARGSLLRPRHP